MCWWATAVAQVQAVSCIAEHLRAVLGSMITPHNGSLSLLPEEQAEA